MIYVLIQLYLLIGIIVVSLIYDRVKQQYRDILEDIYKNDVTISSAVSVQLLELIISLFPLVYVVLWPFTLNIPIDTKDE